jgi:GT2 family glycosyltransferase
MRIRYKRLPGSRTLGAKRNLCVAECRGDLILHWDDDDWFAAHRISYQVEAFLRAGAEICGLSQMLFHDLPTQRTWLYQVPEHERRWLAGGSLLYSKDFWSRSPFPDVQVGSDTAFVWSQSLDGAVALEDPEIYVAMIHGQNTSPKPIDEPNWIPWSGDLRRILGDDFDFYDFARNGESVARRPGEAAPRTEIIVPTFGQEEFTVRCFDSILAHTEAYRLVWVDNGSPAASRATIQTAFARHRERLAIWSDQNLGFVGGTNLGLRAILGDYASDADYVVLLNNDTEVTSGWLDRLTAALEHDPSIAAAGPMTSESSSWQAWPNVFALWQEQPPHSLASASPADASETLARTFGELEVPASMIAFFCAVFRKRVFTEVGLLDPRFGAGLGDDDDYCLRLRNAGYGLAFVPGAYVVHHHRTTFRAIYSDEEIVAMQHENLEKYRTKHGIV